jgi:hypothetical protein
MYRPTYNTARDEAEIDDVLNRCADAEDEGRSQYSGMTYEQGVRIGIEWLLGITDESPFESDER